jgi:hypothetical protein
VLQVHDLAVRAGFGCVLDLRPVRSGRDVRSVCSYVSKYVTKSSDQRQDVPWSRIVQVLDEETGELSDLVNPDPTYRTWSASRGYGLTMRAIREALRAHVTRPAVAGLTEPPATALDRRPAACLAPG